MAVGKEQSRLLSITVSTGSGTGTITNEWSICRWVRLIPTSETDTYNVTFMDADGDPIVVRTGMTGTLSEQLDLSLGILRTIAISNASIDGTYKLKLDMH